LPQFAALQSQVAELTRRLSETSDLARQADSSLRAKEGQLASTRDAVEKLQRELVAERARALASATERDEARAQAAAVTARRRRRSVDGVDSGRATASDDSDSGDDEGSSGTLRPPKSRYYGFPLWQVLLLMIIAGLVGRLSARWLPLTAV